MLQLQPLFIHTEKHMNKNPMVNFQEERSKDIEGMNNPSNVRNQFKDKSLEECKEHCNQDRLPFDACFMNITSDLNISASIRTLHLLGVDKIYILGKQKLDRRALVGAEFYTNIIKLGGLDLDNLTIDENVFLQVINSNSDYFPIFVEQGGENLINLDWNKTLKNNDNSSSLYRPLLIFGNEYRGIGENILALRKQLSRSITVTIPMKGVLRSLNVSASVAAVTWDMVSNIYKEQLGNDCL